MKKKKISKNANGHCIIRIARTHTHAHAQPPHEVDGEATFELGEG